MILFKFLLTIFIGVSLNQIRQCVAVPKDGITLQASNILGNSNVKLGIPSPDFARGYWFFENNHECGGSIIRTNDILLTEKHCLSPISAAQNITINAVDPDINSVSDTVAKVLATCANLDYARQKGIKDMTPIKLSPNNKPEVNSNAKAMEIPAPNSNTFSDTCRKEGGIPLFCKLKTGSSDTYCAKAAP